MENENVRMCEMTSFLMLDHLRRPERRLKYLQSNRALVLDADSYWLAIWAGMLLLQPIAIVGWINSRSKPFARL